MARSAGPADFEEIRRTAIIAMFSDDTLYERLVIKGGNALRLIHQIGSRVSLDIDLSADGPLDEPETAKRMERSLVDRFDAIGLRVFDFKFEQRPSNPREPLFSGFQATFKLAPMKDVGLLSNDLSKARRQSVVVGDQQERVFTIDISNSEYCGDLEIVELDSFNIRVYSPAMIAIEKYRALCQQSDLYEFRIHKTRRARDFLDIHSIVVARSLELTNAKNRELFERIFEAKRVPLTLLRDIESQREFHREDWPSVEKSAPSGLSSFDFYFDFALKQIEGL